MRHSFTSEADAEPEGLATGHNYWFGRPAAADVAYNRGILPAGYLISSAEDMTHYLIAQLHDGNFEGTSRPLAGGDGRDAPSSRPTSAADTSYGMGWFVGPVNDLPAVFHQGETFTYHANIVLLPESDEGVVILMNAENSVDLFTRGRMGTIASGVASMLEGTTTRPTLARTPVHRLHHAVRSHRHPSRRHVPQHLSAPASTPAHRTIPPQDPHRALHVANLVGHSSSSFCCPNSSGFPCSRSPKDCPTLPTRCSSAAAWRLSGR